MVEKIFGTSRKPPEVKQQQKMLDYTGLAAKGICYHPNHLRTLWEAGRFPKPVKLSPRKLVWPEEVIDEWIKNKIELANYKVTNK
jgi:predicted DNA-binding transcriptional regulator AlpA